MSKVTIRNMLTRLGSKSKDDDEVEDVFSEYAEIQTGYCGWLTRKAMLSSKKYWCSLHGNWLSFWKSKEEHQVAGNSKSSSNIDLSTAHQVLLSHNSKLTYGIEIVTDKETTTLLAPSKTECNEWISNLRDAMQFRVRADTYRKSSISGPSVSESTSEPVPDPPNVSTIPPTPAARTSTTTRSTKSGVGLYEEIYFSPQLPSSTNNNNMTQQNIPTATAGNQSTSMQQVSGVKKEDDSPRSSSELYSQIIKPKPFQANPSLSQSATGFRPVAAPRLSGFRKVTPPGRTKTKTMSTLLPVSENEDPVEQATPDHDVTTVMDGGKKVEVRMRRSSSATADTTMSAAPPANGSSQLPSGGSKLPGTSESLVNRLTRLENDLESINVTGMMSSEEHNTHKELPTSIAELKRLLDMSHQVVRVSRSSLNTIQAPQYGSSMKELKEFLTRV